MRLPASPAERSSDPRGGYAIQLDRGSLCAEVASRDLGSEGAFRVKTRQLEVTVIGTHFCVEAGPDLSSVSVQRGRVRVAREGVSVVLGAGESIRSDAPPLRAALLPPQRAWRDRPAPGNPLNAQVAAQDDAPEPLGSLSLENELYQRALQEARRENHPQAAGLLADYLKRFPTGLYAPEAGSELATELGLAGRPGEALAAARERLRSFPRDPHDGDVKLLMAGLLREDLGRPADALAVYEDLLNASAGPDWRAEALFGKGVCEERLGDSAVARELWRRYQAEYPAGRHAAEVERLLGE
jgi:TolA-binding protein